MTRHDEDNFFLPSLRGEVDSFFSEVLGLRSRRGGSLDLWNPTLDLVEEPERYVLEMDVPGVRLEDLTIRVVGRRLTVAGNRVIVRETAGPRVRHSERFSGSFSRSIDLPESVDEARVRASLREGILRVELPKQVRPR